MRKFFYVPLILSLGSLLITPNVYAVPSLTLNSSDRVFAQTQPLTFEQLRQLATSITVRVDAAQNSASGVIIAKNGQTYTVITNAHVVKQGQPYRIQTSDGTTHQATLQTSEDSITGNDLALLQFQSPNNYNLATLDTNSKISPNQTVYAAGYPYDSKELTFSEGKITLITPKPIRGGYQIGFSNPTEQGMSGGVLLNQNGQVIGILGQGQAILTDAYNYQDGTKPDAATLQQMQQASFAIKSESVSFLAKLYSADSLSTIPRQVNQIAQQITVRLDVPGGNGTGVIVGRNGQTYYVLTASHVVEGQKELRLITPDAKSYSVKAEAVKTFEGVDIALVQFTSSETYQVATLADYPVGNFKQVSTKLDIITPLVFLSGFPGVKSGTPIRKLNAGTVYPQLSNLFATKDQYSSTQGLELTYSCQSLPGMSGGAILDQQGRLIGINAGAEDETITQGEQEEEIYLGNSLGVPIKTFLGQLNKANLNPQWFKIETNAPDALTNDQIKQILNSLFTLKPPTETSSAAEWLNYGKLQGRIEQYDQAIEAYEKAIARNPQFYQAYYLKGRTLLGQDKDAEAFAAFDKATQIEPNFYVAWYWKAQALDFLKKSPEALTAIDKAIQLNPKDPKYYNLRGAILSDLERDPEADESLTEAIKLKPNAQAYITRGIQRSVWANYEGAIADFTEVIKLQPNYSGGYLSRGAAQAQRGTDLFSAFQDLEMAIKLDSGNILVYSLRGIIRKQLGDNEGAIADLTQVIENPTQVEQESLIDAYGVRAITYYDLKEFNKAIADFTKLIELQPNNADRYFSRGLYYLLAKEQQKALADFNKTIELQPDYAQAYLNRGGIYRELKEEQKALADFKKTVEIYTQRIQKYAYDPTNYAYRSFARQQLGDQKGAEEDRQKFNQLKAEGVSINESTAVVQQFRHKQQGMQAYYTKAIEAKKDDSKLYFYRGIITHDLRDYQLALEDFNRSLQLNPNHAEAYYRRGLTYSALKDYQKAISDYSQALNLKIFEDTDVYLNRSLAYINLKDFNRGIADLTEVINRRPNADVIFTRGVLYQKQGNTESALADYKLAVEQNKNFVPAIINIGYIFYEKGQVEAALGQWEKAIEINPNLPEPQFALAVALYAKGEQAKGLEIAQNILSKDKTWANLDTLKQNLWGDKLVVEANKLLQHPEISAVVNQ